MSLALITLLLAGCHTGTDGPQQSAAAPRGTFDASTSIEWPSYGHDYGNQRFSPLHDINKGTVSNLSPAYVFQTGVVGAFETNPLVDDGVMYLTTANDGLFAIDAKSGSLRWKIDPLRGNFRQCCGPVNRGVAIWGNLVLIGRLDGRVAALDRATGAKRWSTQVADNSLGYSLTMAPLVYRDLVIVGVGGGDLGIRGALIALSLRDGRIRWRWFATDAQHWLGATRRLRTDNGYIESAAADRARRQFANSWMRGGGGIWTTPAVDPTRDTLYVTTGNPWPDLDGTNRPGDNLFTDCIVALNASTGKMRWYFQEVPHDTMDLDAASPPVLFRTVDENGRSVDALGEIGKTGHFYILDRDNGKLIRQSQDVSSVRMPGHGSQAGWTGGASWSNFTQHPYTDAHYYLPISITTAVSLSNTMKSEVSTYNANFTCCAMKYDPLFTNSNTWADGLLLKSGISQTNIDMIVHALTSQSGLTPTGWDSSSVSAVEQIF